ncbi:MAG: hypothetical protein V4649_13725 [Bacteroidota bacterium]
MPAILLVNTSKSMTISVSCPREAQAIVMRKIVKAQVLMIIAV